MGWDLYNICIGYQTLSHHKHYGRWSQVLWSNKVVIFVIYCFFSGIFLNAFKVLSCTYVLKMLKNNNYTKINPTFLVIITIDNCYPSIESMQLYHVHLIKSSCPIKRFFSYIHKQKRVLRYEYMNYLSQCHTVIYWLNQYLNSFSLTKETT